MCDDAGRSRKQIPTFLMLENTQFDSLPKRLESREFYVYAIPMIEILKKIKFHT